MAPIYTHSAVLYTGGFIGSAGGGGAKSPDIFPPTGYRLISPRRSVLVPKIIFLPHLIPSTELLSYAILAYHVPYRMIPVPNDHRVDRVLGFFSSRPRWDHPPLTPRECVPSLLVPEGGTQSHEGQGVWVPIRTRG
jgi:hypothetical protein